VGGLYGVFVAGVFVGESMFHLEPNVTKLALLALIDRLSEKGHQFIDTQMAIGLAGKWGARLVPRTDYEWRLRFAQVRNLSY
jgi:leucyl/phenylalanyl-tRNA--protein transferase